MQFELLNSRCTCLTNSDSIEYFFEELCSRLGYNILTLNFSDSQEFDPFAKSDMELSTSWDPTLGIFLDPDVNNRILRANLIKTEALKQFQLIVQIADHALSATSAKDIDAPSQVTRFAKSRIKAILDKVNKPYLQRIRILCESLLSDTTFYATHRLKLEDAIWPQDDDAMDVDSDTVSHSVPDSALTWSKAPKDASQAKNLKSDTQLARFVTECFRLRLVAENGVAKDESAEEARKLGGLAHRLYWPDLGRMMTEVQTMQTALERSVTGVLDHERKHEIQEEIRRFLRLW